MFHIMNNRKRCRVKSRSRFQRKRHKRSQFRYTIDGQCRPLLLLRRLKPIQRQRQLRRRRKPHAALECSAASI
jgi:hypothetical protein